MLGTAEKRVLQHTTSICTTQSVSVFDFSVDSSLVVFDVVYLGRVVGKYSCGLSLIDWLSCGH